MFLVTVRHTGGTSLKKQYPECEHLACNEASLERAKTGEKALTTYRDPGKVAESWKRRGWFEHKKFKDMWWSEWKFYDAISKLDNVEVMPVDGLDYHLNHVDGEDYPGKFLDDSTIAHAFDCSDAAVSKAVP